MNTNRIYRIMVIGSGGGGKTALIFRYIRGHFVTLYDPTLENIYKKMVNVKGQQIIIEVVDTSGQEAYSALREVYLATGDGFLLVYAINDRLSFHRLKHSYIPLFTEQYTVIPPMILVANKSDMEESRKVSTNEAVNLANELGLELMEVSAKTNTGIDTLFETLIEKIISSTSTPLTSSRKNKRKGCTLL